MQIERGLRAVIDEFAERFLEVNIVAIAEDDAHVVYAVRVPREASPDHDDLVALASNDAFGADLAARIRHSDRG